MSVFVTEALRRGADMLREAAMEEASGQARLLLAHALQIAPKALPAYFQQSLTEEQEQAYAGYIARRQAREPLQYILGEWGFMGLEFFVEPEVLIPRQDTETLCEAAIAQAKARGYKNLLDVCCGTGCIGISIGKLANMSVAATDISEACIALTKRNGARNGVKVDVRLGNWFSAIDGRYDMIVSNPPYLTGLDMRALQPEVAREPELALYGGEDGMDGYRALAEGYLQRLHPGGAMLLEVGRGQAGAVVRLFARAKTTVTKDIAGVDRVVTIFP